ncbi:MAG: class II aldolase/adducin family protein [Rubrivivax sp.]
MNPTGFTIHGAVHRARPEVECVAHLHAPWGVALSMLPGGLQPTSQWAMRLHGRLGTHAYEGLALGADEERRLTASLGSLDGLVLQNHGTLTVGRTVAEAFMLMHLLERAVDARSCARWPRRQHFRVRHMRRASSSPAMKSPRKHIGSGSATAASGTAMSHGRPRCAGSSSATCRA